MAQLKDTVITGSLRVTDNIYTNIIQTSILKVPTNSNGTDIGPGTTGNILFSNGSTASYWGSTTNITSVGTITSGTWNGTTIAIANGGTGQTTDILALKALGGPYINFLGEAFTSTQNIDSLFTPGTYYAGSASAAATLTGTNPITGAGYKMFVVGGYTTTRNYQFILGNSTEILYRAALPVNNVPTWGKWRKVVVMPAGDDNKTITAIGSTTQPVYVTNTGDVATTLGIGNGKVFYGVCPSTVTGGTAEKAVNCAEFTSADLVAGTTIHVLFAVKNTAAVGDLTLNVNGTGAKDIKKIYQTGGVQNLTHASELPLNGVVSFVYTGAYWQVIGLDYNNTYTITAIDCQTSAGTPGKSLSNAAWYTLRKGNRVTLTMRYTNTAASALTIGGKALYINGKPSSSTNYTLPAGRYSTYYDGTNYHVRTDKKIPETSDIYCEDFTLNTANGGTVTISTEIYDEPQGVSVVVTSGYSYLQSPITWTTTTDNNGYQQIQVSATVGGIVEGYISFKQ